MFELPTMEVPVPTIEEVGLGYLGDLLQERQNLKQTKEDCDSRIKEIDKEVRGTLEGQEIRTVVWNDHLVIRRFGAQPRAILDRVLLLEAGVSPQQLKAGTKFGDPGEPGITVRSLSEVKSKRLEEFTGE